MIYLREAPVGVDEEIQRWQKILWTRLLQKWGIRNEEDYKCYGRCYRNQKENGYVPEMYMDGTEQDYADLFLDDTLKVTSFFGCENLKINATGGMVADVHLIFAVDLAKLFPGAKTRMDEEARNDVYQIMKNNRSFALTSVVWGIEKVFTEYTAWKKDIKFRDMQPFHFFRLNFTLNYLPNNSCLPPLNS